MSLLFFLSHHHLLKPGTLRWKFVVLCNFFYPRWLAHPMLLSGNQSSIQFGDFYNGIFTSPLFLLYLNNQEVPGWEY
ncbi:MAG: hypothetical protein IPO68_06340 [Chitinophagaceae bacterium]|nr:hypothetical protein [Chitinophagaceae bacterium]